MTVMTKARKERTMTNELTQNKNEITRDERPDYTEFYDRLKIQYSAGQELYDKDPDKYPAYSKEEIIENVENYGWILGEARGGGVCVRMPNGRIIYGSPPPASLPVIAEISDICSICRTMKDATIILSEAYEITTPSSVRVGRNKLRIYAQKGTQTCRYK